MSELKPCPFCGKTGRCDVSYPHPSADYKATRTVNIAEIIEQVRSLQHEKSLMVSDERAAGRYDAVGDVIEILERYR